ncbi:MAG TPA: hypothetical protein VI365_34570, partial [Trebonia sp.]
MSQNGVAETAETELMRTVAALAVLMPAVALIQVVADSGDYRQPVVAFAVWLGVLGAAAWLVPRLRGGGLSAGETLAAFSIALVAVVAVAATRRPNAAPGSVDLAILGTAGLLILVVMSRPARVWIPGTLLVFTAHSAVIIGEGGL